MFFKTMLLHVNRHFKICLLFFSCLSVGNFTLRAILLETGLSKLFAIDWQPATLNYVAVTKYFLKQDVDRMLTFSLSLYSLSFEIEQKIRCRKT